MKNDELIIRSANALNRKHAPTKEDSSTLASYSTLYQSLKELAEKAQSPRLKAFFTNLAKTRHRHFRKELQSLHTEVHRDLPLDTPIFDTVRSLELLAALCLIVGQYKEDDFAKIIMLGRLSYLEQKCLEQDTVFIAWWNDPLLLKHEAPSHDTVDKYTNIAIALYSILDQHEKEDRRSKRFILDTIKSNLALLHPAEEASLIKRFYQTLCRPEFNFLRDRSWFSRQKDLEDRHKTSHTWKSIQQFFERSGLWFSATQKSKAQAKPSPTCWLEMTCKKDRTGSLDSRVSQASSVSYS